jgi:AcrR family transcriptional regulator
MGRHREFDVDQALDAALSVFWRKGYEGASYEDLSTATKVSRPGLYSAFGNKQALFVRALDRYDARYMGFMQEALDEPTSRQVVERILRGSAEVQTLNPESPGCLGMNGALACSDEAESIRTELVRRRQGTQEALRQRLERARAEGDLPATADPATLAAFVMAISQGMAVQAKAGATRASLLALVDHVLSTWPATTTL